MEKNMYEKKTNIGGFKTNVSRSENAPYYFEKSNVRFFKSKVTDVYANKDNTKYLARETIQNPSGKSNYKILYYDYKKNKLYPSKIYENKSVRDDDYREIK